MHSLILNCLHVFLCFFKAYYEWASQQFHMFIDTITAFDEQKYKSNIYMYMYTVQYSTYNMYISFLICC